MKTHTWFRIISSGAKERNKQNGKVKRRRPAKKYGENTGSTNNKRRQGSLFLQQSLPLEFLFWSVGRSSTTLQAKKKNVIPENRTQDPIFFGASRQMSLIVHRRQDHESAAGNTLFFEKRFHGGREIRTHAQRPMSCRRHHL